MKTANIDLYTFDELNEEAKAKAIEEERLVMLAIMQPSDFISGVAEYDTPEELEKSYRAEYGYIISNDEPVLESLKANEYFFFADGSAANVQFRADGSVYLKLNGEEYNI